MLTLAPTAEPWTGCALHPSPVPRVLLELALASLFHDGPRSYPRSPPRGCHPPLMPGPAMPPAPGGSRSFCYDKSQNRVVGDVEETGGVVEAWLPCAPAPWPPPLGNRVPSIPATGPCRSLGPPRRSHRPTRPCDQRLTPWHAQHCATQPWIAWQLCDEAGARARCAWRVVAGDRVRP